MLNKLNQKNQPLTKKLKAFIVVGHILLISIILIGAAVLLIGVNHTSIYLIEKAWAPLFLYFVPTATVLLAAGVIFLNQPVHSLLCLISVFISVTSLYIYVGAEFLAFLFLIVYVGAIAILFIFVIMLLQLKEVVTSPALATTGLASLLLPSAVFTFIGMDDLVSEALTTYFVESDSLAFKAVVSSADPLVHFVTNRFTDILAFSSLLYTYHCALFVIAGLLLLTAMLGAIVLATSATDPSTSAIDLSTNPTSTYTSSSTNMSPPCVKGSDVRFGLVFCVLLSYLAACASFWADSSACANLIVKQHLSYNEALGAAKIKISRILDVTSRSSTTAGSSTADGFVKEHLTHMTASKSANNVVTNLADTLMSTSNISCYPSCYYALFFYSLYFYSSYSLYFYFSK